MVSEIARKNKNAAPASLYDETTLRNHRNADNQRRDAACFGAVAINHRWSLSGPDLNLIPRLIDYFVGEDFRYRSVLHASFRDDPK